jgi:hypothetical protein
MMYTYLWDDKYPTGKTMVEVSVNCVECGQDHGGLRHGQWLRESEIGACPDKGCMCKVGNLYESDDAADYRREARENQIPGYANIGDGYYQYTGGPEIPGKIREERGSHYGPVECNHLSIGYIWGGLLMQAVESKRWKAGEPIPPELVTLMMVGVKLSREAFKHKDDNIVDGKNYLDFTGELSE